MDKRAAEQFIEEYVALCKRSGMYLWSGEPWYGLDLIDGDIDEDKESVSFSVTMAMNGRESAYKPEKSDN